MAPWTKNTRLRLLPLTARFVAPGPRMAIPLSSTSSPLVRPMVEPLSAGAKVMIPLGHTLEMAQRSEPMPLSLVFTTVMSGEQTVMRKEHEAEFVQASVAVQFTGLTPRGKAEPEGGVQMVEASVQLSVAETAKVTLLAVPPEVTGTTRFDEHEITGGMVSRTVIVCVAEILLA